MAKQQEFMKDNDKGNLKGNWVSLVAVNQLETNFFDMQKILICKMQEDIYYLPFSFLLTQVFRTEQKSTKVHLLEKGAFPCNIVLFL